MKLSRPSRMIVLVSAALALIAVILIVLAIPALNYIDHLILILAYALLLSSMLTHKD